MKTATGPKNTEKYRGNFVATKSFKDKEIISYGHNPTKVLKEANEKGVEEPVIMYVPKENMAFIY